MYTENLNSTQTKSIIGLDMTFMAALYDFYYSDKYVLKYSDYLKTRIFEVGWEVLYQDKLKIKFFDNPVVQTYFKNFLYSSLVYIRLFGFCMYYIIKDFDGWYLNFPENTIDFEKKPPFGILNLDEVHLYYEKDLTKFGFKLTLLPKNKDLINKYKYHIFNHDFREDRLRMYDIEKLPKSIYDFFSDTKSDNKYHLIKPFSKFTSVREKKFKLEEIELSRDNANWMSCYPEILVIPETTKDVSLQDIYEGNLYTNDDILTSKSKQKQKITTLSLNAAQDDLIKIQKLNGLNGTIVDKKKGEISNRNTIKKILKRVNMSDGIKLIHSENAKIMLTNEPKSLIDLNLEENLYEKMISEIFKIPQQFFTSNQFSKNNKNSSNTMNRQIDTISIQKTIEFDQNLINEIFINIYKNSFGKIEGFIKSNNMLNGVNELIQTKIHFFESNFIDNEKIPLLLQLFQFEVIDKKKMQEIINQWI